MPRSVSILVALLLVMGLMTLLVILITISTRGLADSAPLYGERLQRMGESAFSILDRFQIDLGQDAISEGLRRLPVLTVVRTTAGGVVTFVSTGVLVLIFTIFLLAGRRPAEMREGIYAEIDVKIRRYLLTRVAVSAVTGIFVGVILGILGLDLALVFGVLAFFLNFIPNVGSVIATVLPLPLALVQFDNWVPVVLVVALPGVVQMTIGNVLEPKIMGDGLQLHPVTILLALVFWGLIWGIVGMLLAAPMTAVLRIVLDRFETTRPIAALLAGRLPGERIVT